MDRIRAHSLISLIPHKALSFALEHSRTHLMTLPLVFSLFSASNISISSRTSYWPVRLQMAALDDWHSLGNSRPSACWNLSRMLLTDGHIQFRHSKETGCTISISKALVCLKALPHGRAERITPLGSTQERSSRVQSCPIGP